MFWIQWVHFWINQFIRIHQQIHLNSSTNWFEFINKFIKIHQWIHLNSSMNSFEFIRKFNWIYQPFKMFTNFLKISLIFIIWIFEKIINEFIELNLSLSFLNFSHFAKLFIKFFKSKSLPWISNRYCHSRNEFTDELSSSLYLSISKSFFISKR